MIPPTERLAELRRELQRLDLDGFIVPRGDQFLGEYVPPDAERLAWLTSFTGSAGAAVVLTTRACVFADGRYTLQVEAEVDSGLYEIRHLIDEPPAKWISKTLPRGGRIGYDPWLHSVKDAATLTKAASQAGGQLIAVDDNPLDTVWTDRPSAPLAPVVAHPIKYSGRTSADKRRALADDMGAENVDAVVLTASDSIAWLLNVRGGDVEFSPLPLAPAILHGDGSVDYFLDDAKLSNGLLEHLGEDVTIRHPESFAAVLDQLAAGENTIAIDPATTTDWISLRLRSHGTEPVDRTDPCQLPKATKNEVELAGIRAAHRRDGAALTTFLAWLARQPDGTVTEISAAEHLLSLRAKSDVFRGPSFATISGAGANGAIVHYRVDSMSNRTLDQGSLYLVDSGGQYPDGTTDVTRTVAIGAPSPEMRDRFTRVLKGHIAIARARFTEGTTGSDLDPLARAALQEIGLDYDHGTGHGVGCYLNVHEGPGRISKRPNSVALSPGMVISNEPGYYKPGAYGIRIENLVAVIAEGGGLAFETLTLAPIDRNLIDVSLLEAHERDWVDAYHRRVVDEIAPLLDGEASDWLAQATAPL